MYGKQSCLSRRAIRGSTAGQAAHEWPRSTVRPKHMEYHSRWCITRRDCLCTGGTSTIKCEPAWPVRWFLVFLLPIPPAKATARVAVEACFLVWVHRHLSRRRLTHPRPPVIDANRAVSTVVTFKGDVVPTWVVHELKGYAEV